MGFSDRHVVVDLPEEGKYALKLPHPSTLQVPRLSSFLSKTTALTPVVYGLNRNFGQPVLECTERRYDGKQLILAVLGKVPGESLNAIEKRAMLAFRAEGQDNDLSYLSAKESLLKMIAGFPEATFDAWMSLKQELLRGRGGGRQHYKQYAV